MALNDSNLIITNFLPHHERLIEVFGAGRLTYQHYRGWRPSKGDKGAMVMVSETACKII